MGVALHGNLEDFGIAEVFQLVGQQRKTGVLEIEHADRLLCIQFYEGSVVTAEARGDRDHDALADMLVRCGLLTRERALAIARDSQASARAYGVVASESGDVTAGEVEQVVDLLTQEVIFEVLRFTSGSFHFSACSVEHDRAPEKLLGAEQILMEGLRMVDEWRTFAPRAPTEDTVLGRCGSFDDYRGRADGGSAAASMPDRSVFELVDGRLSVRRVIDLSRVGTFDGTRYLVGLLDAGVIEAVESIAAAPKLAREPRMGSLVAGARWVLAAVLPIVLLALVAWASGRQLIAPASLPGTPIDALAFERGVASFETRRLRHALEAHRHLWSSWPDELAAVDRTGWDGPRALAASEVGSYYYVQRGDGVLVLPPDPGAKP